MKINKYYRDIANLNLNGGIAALVPTILIIVLNLSIIRHREIMLCTIPFILYSIISFQLYLFRMRQSLEISRSLVLSGRIDRSIFEASHLLVLFRNTQFSRIHLYFPDGHLAGMVKKHRGNGWERLKPSRTFALYNSDQEVLGFFNVKGRKSSKIDVFGRNRRFLGSFEKKRLGWRKYQKELFNELGRYVGAIEGSSVFMDEQVMDIGHQQVGRLRRGWMPLEWSSLFPEPNTPVLSFNEALSGEEKLLRMSLLINEYFIER
ncbi:hypothetical protein RCG19_00500 [Neobacillus sp. OS1-2]|uniref:hypothetical protein n=1 Tax=Neobacillus sp. OS1-2 TaxID=3070680 RepID=UPI0027E1C7BC|nr:hypothetical protein [Neobacillus sp. OS1-2]WML40200.1 hypothetical protein RCG19_00500 [Neobacillus sp. OS1-2]